MKYYTKQWLEDLKNADFILNFQKIKEDKYTNTKIKALYDEKLRLNIEEDQKDYNTEPEKPDYDFDDLELEDIIIVDEQTNALKHPSSFDEAKAFIDEEYKQALVNFKSRTPYDPTDTIDVFEEAYEASKKYIKEESPDWLLKEVPINLLALGYIPTNAYNKLKKECALVDKNIAKIESKASKEMLKQDIPTEVYDALMLHDASILSLKKQGKDLIMLTSDETYPSDVSSPYKQITFTNADVLENEKIKPRKMFNGFVYYSNTNFLYHEIYNFDEGYEVHMMVYTPKGIAYLTLTCDDVICEEVDLNE